MKPVAAPPGSECEQNPRAITRRQLLGSLAGLGAGSVLVLPGCEALQQASAPGREGTGIQGSLFIKVLLKYPASPRQQAVARNTARRAFVDRGMRPAFADAKKKAQQRHRKEEAVARRQNAGDPAKQQQAVAQVQEEGSRQLAAIEDSYRKVALQITDNKYSGEFAPAKSSRTVAQVETRPQILTASAAYVAPNVAVPVPAERAVAGAAASVMIYNNRTHELARNDVYVLASEPAEGRVSQIGDVSAEYVER